VIGAFEPEPDYRAAYELWTDYYNRTEAFDRGVCSGTSPRTGLAMPIDNEERRAIEANARRMMHELERERAKRSISDGDWRRAQANALRDTERGQR
jgi:hypothetical protein